MSFLWFASLLLLSSVASVSYGKSCKAKLRSHHIIPRFADSVDTTNITIVYDVIGKNEVKCGNKLLFATIELPPKIIFDATKYCYDVTILLFDPDAPVLPPYVVWMVTNVNTKELKEGNLDSGNVALFYSPAVSNKRKYVFFVYCQSKEVDFTGLVLERLSFQPKDFAEKYGLRAVAANFFVTDLAPEAVPVDLPPV